MLIGETFVAGDRGRRARPQPENRGADRSTCPKPRFSRSTRPSAQRRRRSRAGRRTTPAERSALLLKLADAIEREARGLRRARSAQLRQAAPPGAERRNPGDRRLLPLLCRRGARHARRGGRRVPRRAHLDDPARSHRRRRLDRALELSADDGGVEARARARRRQHGRPEALRADAADDAQARAARRRHLPARRRQRDRRARRDRRQCAHQSPEGRDGVADRRRRDRQESARPPPPRRSSARTSSSAERRR